MKAFELAHPTTVAEASRQMAGSSHDINSPRLMGGGQDLLGMMKDYLYTPDRVIDLKRIDGLRGASYNSKSGLKIGALTTITQIAEHKDIQAHFPVLANAALSVASLQIRNVGTVGGNLCQRPRCWYFRNEHIMCLKKGGDRCYAAPENAENKYHAIFGGGPCHIVHPSDLAPALMSLGSVVHVTSSRGGDRAIPIDAFYTLPSQGSIYQETVLKPDEVVTHVTVPVTPVARRSVYIKFREKESFDWSLVSVAMAVDVDGGLVKDCRIVLGGVAQIPWRIPAAEAALKGKSLSNAAVVEAAAQAATKGAVPLSQNGYKVALTQALVRRAAGILAAGKQMASDTGGAEEWIA